MRLQIGLHERVSEGPLPRIDTIHEPASCDCTTCGAARVKIGEHVSEKLDCKPIEFFVRRDMHPQIDNNPIENAIRPIAIGRKNWLFAGSETAGHRAAAIMSLLAIAKANDIEPHALAHRHAHALADHQ